VIADHVALPCLRTAKTGGESQMMSAYSLHNRLIERNPDLLEILYQRFHFDRPGVQGGLAFFVGGMNVGAHFHHHFDGFLRIS